MNNEWKHCTVEQSKRLVELGIVLETDAYWERNIANEFNLTFIKLIHSEHYPAPDVSELGVFLGKYTVMQYEQDRVWRLYDESGILKNWLPDSNATEALARCAALIWLIENKYIQPVDLKL